MLVAGSESPGAVEYLHQLAKVTPLQMVDEDAVSTIDWSGVRGVVVGTTLGDAVLDKTLIATARRYGKPSVACIDHWSWYRERFATANGLLLPDWIVVNDQIAREQACAAGLPDERLFVGGNPVIEARHYQVSTSQSLAPDSLKSDYGLTRNGRIVLYVSEDLASDFGSGSDSLLGYDEFQVADLIKQVLRRNEKMVIKLHPSDSPRKYRHLGDEVAVIAKAPVDHMAVFSDVIVGTASMLLLELAVYRNDIVSFRPHPKKSFIGDEIGATVAVRTADQFRWAIDNHQTTGVKFGQHYVGSARAIADFIDEVTR